MHATGDSDAADVFDFVDEFLTDREKGLERPLAHYLARYPRCQSAVAREYLALTSPGDEEPKSRAGRSPQPDVDGGAQRIGPYRILGEIGRGGQGAVFLAEDSRIARRVALKVLASRFDLVSEERRKRFRREAEVIARLEHPGLCGIYEADIEGETPYIAMRHVEGSSLAQILSAARAAGDAAASGFPPRTPLEVRGVLHLFERIARALHAAHEAGVVHRDVKPGNVMIAPDGRPVLLDFGLARDETSDAASLTLSGDVFGTPGYMSPEQLGGGETLDRRTDVYSLAVSLYEALTLVRPFEAPSRIELYRRILEEPVPDPRRHNPRLDEDVRVVLETALERDRGRRYASALELAEDLRRIREYEPIRARPAGALLRLSRWSRRHPALAVSIAGTILSLSAGLVLSLHLIGKRDVALGEADRSLGYALGRHLAERCVALVDEDPALALAVGVEAAEREIRDGGSRTGANYLTRSALFRALDACWLERVLSIESARLATDLSLSPDGLRAAIATDRGTAQVFELDGGRMLLDLPSRPAPIVRVFHAAAGEEIAMAYADGLVRLVRADSGALVREIDTGDALVAADVAPDGALLVAVGCGGRAVVLDVATGGIAARLDGGIEWAAFVPGSASTLLVRTAAGAVSLRDAVEGRLLRDLDAGGVPVVACALASGSERAAFARLDGQIRVLDLPDGEPAGAALHLDGPAGFLALSPDGRRLLAATDRNQTGELDLFDAATGERRALAGHAGRRVVAGAFSPDGRRFATASFDATVRVWSASSGAQLRVLASRARPSSILWTEDGGRILAANLDSSANVWFARNRPDLFDLQGHSGPVLRAAFSPDGRTVLTASADGTARLWSVPPPAKTQGRNLAREPGALLRTLKLDGPLTDAGFDRSGNFVLTTSADGTARVWSARTGEPIGGSRHHPAAVLAGALDARAESLLTVCADGSARVYRLDSGDSPATIAPAAGPVLAAAFAPDGARIACASSADSVGLWDARTGAHVRDLRFEHGRGYEPGVAALAFSPGGRELAIACADAKVRFFDPETGATTRKDLVVFPPRAVAYSADGTKLLVTGRFGGGAAKVFLLGEPRPPVQAEIAHAWSSNLAGGAFSADGSLVLTYATDGSAHVWESTTGRPVAHREGGSASILDGAFDGGTESPRVIVARDDGTVSVWPVDPLPAARARRPRELTPLEKERERRLALPLHYE